MRGREVVFLSGVRTPSGRFGGALKGYRATELGALVIKEAIRRAGISPRDIGSVAMGNVLQAGQGQNPARQAAIGAGIPPEASAFTVNMVCGSGLKAINLIAQLIALGELEVGVAGGMESMSQAPYLLKKARWGSRLGHAELEDVILRDGLEDAYSGWHMGLTAELVAEKYDVSRQEMDEYAMQSHQKAWTATQSGAFKEEILPIEVREDKVAKTLDADETIRPDTTMEALAKLKPAFKEGGRVTAGNSPGLNDGAAALVLASGDFARARGLTPLARLVETAEGGVEPQWVLMAPAAAYENLRKKTGWTWDDFDLIEINEAFSAQMVALIKTLEIPRDKLNVRGGAVALGHPIGCSGARIMVTLLHSLRSLHKKRGFESLCLGGGNAVSAVVETV
jgi:acetyl-CoA C-acetyltransferase